MVFGGFLKFVRLYGFFVLCVCVLCVCVSVCVVFGWFVGWFGLFDLEHGGEGNELRRVRGHSQIQACDRNLSAAVTKGFNLCSRILF